MSVAVDGEPLSAEAVRMLEYLRARAVSLTGAGIRERVRAAAQELERAVAPGIESQSRLSPTRDKCGKLLSTIARGQLSRSCGPKSWAVKAFRRPHRSD
jgi:hypothetical protein